MEVADLQDGSREETYWLNEEISKTLVLFLWDLLFSKSCNNRHRFKQGRGQLCKWRNRYPKAGLCLTVSRQEDYGAA